MEAINAFQDVVFWLIVALLWWLWCDIKKYRREEVRQKLFAIRDDLFMEASRGEIAFDSEAYNLMRKVLNGAIRYTERLTLFGVAWAHVELKKNGLENRFAEVLREAMDILDSDEQRKLIASTLNRTNQALIEYLVESNLLILLIANFSIVMKSVHIRLASVSSLVRKISKSLRSTMNGDILLDSLLTRV